jgi:uncharacterized protein YndB with AHSA1/START domain
MRPVLVFDAFTKPHHLKRWVGLCMFTLVSCESELRTGGRYCFVHRAPDGQEFAFSGESLEVVRPERIVRTFLFEPMPDHEAVETLTLEEGGGKTTVTTLTVHKTLEGRDGHLSGGHMEASLTERYARLEELLAGLQTHLLVLCVRLARVHGRSRTSMSFRVRPAGRGASLQSPAAPRCRPAPGRRSARTAPPQVARRSARR